MQKKFFLYITGCDMNHSDAERIATVFNENGVSITSDESEADVFVAVACSVREKAVHKVLGKVNEWRKKVKSEKSLQPGGQVKVKNYGAPKARHILVTGCVLPEDKKKFERKADLVFSIDEIEKLRDLLKKVSNDKYPISNQCQISNDQYLSIIPQYKNKFSAYLPIMTGCDNFCSYCAVPYTRGREVSRPEEEILAEVRGLVEAGYKEITLLGQNVNSYGVKIKNEKLKIKNYGVRQGERYVNKFVELLEKIDEIPGDHWIRFYANHPKDFSGELIDFLKNAEHFCHYIHLPLQSGDDEILKKMNRHYTTKQYIELVNKIRKEIPDVTLATDIIVGFPGESEEAFENTAKVLREIGFDMIFISEYSIRPGTVAEKMKDDVSHEEKERRKKYLNDIVLAESFLENGKKLIGKKVKVLIHKKDKKGVLMGRTAGLKDVRISVGEGGALPEIGSFVDVKIVKAGSWGLEADLEN